MSYLYGLRYMQIDERFHFGGVGTTDTFDPSGTLINSQTNTGDYDIGAHNNLLGLQFGADMTFRECRWSWGVSSRMGPFINFADQESWIASGPVGEQTLQRLADAKHVASLMGQVGFFATWKFRPNLVGRASYDFTWVTGLALAPEQIQFAENPVNHVNTNGTLFEQGISLSLEWLW
jgi:hypothetical protein